MPTPARRDEELIEQEGPFKVLSAGMAEEHASLSARLGANGGAANGKAAGPSAGVNGGAAGGSVPRKPEGESAHSTGQPTSGD